MFGVVLLWPVLMLLDPAQQRRPEAPGPGRQVEMDSYPTRIVLPVYPRLAKTTGSSATFCVAIQVSPTGEVSDASIVEQDLGVPSADASVFTGDLLQAVRQWKYPVSRQPRSLSLRVKYTIWHITEKVGTVFEPPTNLELREYFSPSININYGPKGRPLPDMKRDPCSGRVSGGP